MIKKIAIGLFAVIVVLLGIGMVCPNKFTSSVRP